MAKSVQCAVYIFAESHIHVQCNVAAIVRLQIDDQRVGRLVYHAANKDMSSGHQLPVETNLVRE